MCFNHVFLFSRQAQIVLGFILEATEYLCMVLLGTCY